MIKVLHINCNYIGTKLHSIMIDHMDKRDISSTIFCPVNKNVENVGNHKENVIIDKCFSTLDRFFYFIKQKKFLAALNKKINIKEFNCIHAYTLFTDGNVAYQIFKKYNIPYVVAIRATDFVFLKYRPYLKKRGIAILNNASAIFFLSKTTQKVFFQSYFGGDYASWQGKVHIIPNGIDDYWIDNKYVSKEKSLNQSAPINIVCVSKIIKRKNIPTLQKAIKILNEEGWKFRLKLIGECIDKDEFKAIVQDTNTMYVPSVNKESLITFYRESDLFVLPSRGETFGLVYAEAMSQGLPVIYSKDEGFDGQFDEGVVGYHVDPNSAEDIAKGIRKLINNYTNISERVADFTERFRWDDIVKKYIRIYEHLINNKDK